MTLGVDPFDLLLLDAAAVDYCAMDAWLHSSVLSISAGVASGGDRRRGSTRAREKYRVEKVPFLEERGRDCGGDCSRASHRVSVLTCRHKDVRP